MSDLPQGWERATFNDVAHIDSNLVDPAAYLDYPHIAPNHIEPKTGRLLQYSTVRADGVVSPKHSFRAHHILYSKIRPYLAKAVLVNFDGLCSADMYPISTPLSRRYLHYWLISSEFTRFAAAKQGRSVLPKINRHDLGRLPVPVVPKAEQQRIVAAIDEHLSRLDAAEASLRSVQRRLALLHLVTLRKADDARWPEVALGSLLTCIEAGKSYKAHGHPAADGEWGIIKVSAMTWGEFDSRENKAVPAGQPVNPRYEIRSGDLLLSRANTSEYVGATVLACDPRPKLLLSDKSMRLIVHDACDKEWLRYSLSSPQLRGQMSMVASGTSDSMRNISQDKVRSLRIHVPPPDVQARLAKEIDYELALVHRLEADLEAAERRSQSLRRSILSTAFSGKLVPQDPDDEPASVLLERIEAGR